ncbi:hypothetical protein [Serratia fonticola]
MKLFLALLKAYWPQLLLAGCAFASGYSIATNGNEKTLAKQELAFTKKFTDQSSAFESERTAWLNEKTQTARDQNAALTAALALQQQYQDKANLLSNQLAATKQQLAESKAKYQRDIVNATQNDGVGYTGLGPDGLCLYRQALGYPCDQRLPETNSGAAAYPADASSPRTGLLPEDLLAHSSDYGEWCQSLKAQLESLNHIYNNGTNK